MPDPIIYRNTDVRWGPGKLANLTPLEVDENFFSLFERITELEMYPLQPLEIEEIVVSGNQMTINMSDGLTSFGPFTLPVASLVWDYTWTPNKLYAGFELFTYNDNLYMTTGPYQAGPTFVMGEHYQLLMPLPRVFDVGFFFPQKPGYGIPAEEPFASYLCLRDWYLIDNAPGSRARLRVAPEAELIIPIFLNTTNIGSITFEAASTTGVIAMDATQFSDNDILRLMSPTELDNTALDLMVTFKGTLGTL